MNRITKTNLQEMFKMIVIANVAVVAAAIFHAASQSFELTATFQIVKNRQRRWNLVDIDLFDSNFDKKFAFTSEIITHAEKDTYYKNIHVFVEKIKKMIIMFKFEMIKKICRHVFVNQLWCDTSRNYSTYSDELFSMKKTWMNELRFSSLVSRLRSRSQLLICWKKNTFWRTQKDIASHVNTRRK
jgi:hypothetical protein